ncbi:PTS transporter subunit EIIC [Erwinia oleae]|uniref:PTS transporter subunit EIIC n=1 Tax=Erwinia oleae TaxID=796334 RepID=UPI00054E1000|nr:PTS transporter subunit EIIC [Erwinia oleae]
MSDSTFLGRITDISQKMASEVHLRSLRDSFVIAIPFLVLAGLFIMLNFVILSPSGMLSGWCSPEKLTLLSNIGDRVLNGTMNILSIMLVLLISYNIASKKRFDTPIIPAMVSLAAFFVLMPVNTQVLAPGGDAPVEVGGVVSYSLTNAGGVFLAILTAVIGTTIFLWISKNRYLTIHLGDDVPPMVAQSFQSMFSIMLTIGIFALAAFSVTTLTHLEIYQVIQQAIQAPLVHLTTNLSGFIALTTLTNVLFSLGIHPSGIINPILEPPLLVAMQENMSAFAQGLIPPHIIVLPFRDLYGHLGGTGSTLSLLLAIMLRSKMSSHRNFSRTVMAPGIFNINEPVIFGFPVLYNPLIMIPFIIAPQINFIIAYFATDLGMVSRIVAYVPWSVPPLLSGWLGSGGDFRNVILQVILLVFGVVAYLPFLMAYERSLIEGKSKKIIDAAGEQRQSVTAPADISDAMTLPGNPPKATSSSLEKANGKTFILMCNEGMSTSIVASKMRKYAESQGCHLQVYAINLGKLSLEYPKADLILLGPQLTYMAENISSEINHHCPVLPIDPQHFSKLDGKAVIEAALPYISK